MDIIATAYFFACCSESVHPGTFQQVYSDTLVTNGLTPVKCITPAQTIIQSVLQPYQPRPAAAPALTPPPPPAPAPAPAPEPSPAPTQQPAPEPPIATTPDPNPSTETLLLPTPLDPRSAPKSMPYKASSLPSSPSRDPRLARRASLDPRINDIIDDHLSRTSSITSISSVSTTASSIEALQNFNQRNWHTLPPTDTSNGLFERAPSSKPLTDSAEILDHLKALEHFFDYTHSSKHLTKEAIRYHNMHPADLINIYSNTLHLNEPYLAPDIASLVLGPHPSISPLTWDLMKQNVKRSHRVANQALASQTLTPNTPVNSPNTTPYASPAASPQQQPKSTTKPKKPKPKPNTTTIGTSPTVTRNMTSIHESIAKNHNVVKIALKQTHNPTLAPTLLFSNALSSDQNKLLRKKYFTSSKEASLATLSSDISNNLIRLREPKQPTGEAPYIDSALCKFLAKYKEYSSKTIRYVLE